MGKHWNRLKRSLSRRWKEWCLPRGYARLGTRYGGWWIDTRAIGPLGADTGRATWLHCLTRELPETRRDAGRLAGEGPRLERQRGGRATEQGAQPALPIHQHTTPESCVRTHSRKNPTCGFVDSRIRRFPPLRCAQSLAQSAQPRAHADHTYENRMKTMLATVGGRQ